ncbi:MAG: FMN-binding protein [Treponema sp.]|jgi:uncharacterized protein with FMN-binding domain|nr:FMN-binding protein [Treponema sp.]
MYWELLRKAAMIVTLMAVLGFAACAGLKAEPEAGKSRNAAVTYEGSGQGYRGPVWVAVQVDLDGIAGIEILEHGDDPFPGGAAMEELLELVLDGNSVDIDGISGATESSAGFLAAVEDALRKADGEPDKAYQGD